MACGVGSRHNQLDGRRVIKVRVKVSGEAGSFAVFVYAGGLREAEQIVKERYPESAVSIAFPIEPNHFFVEGSHHDRYAGLVVTERLAEPRGGHRSTGITGNLSSVVCLS